MANPIEVTRYDDSQALNELFSLTYANKEPGFQIEGVRNLDELLVVFAALRDNAPRETVAYRGLSASPAFGIAAGEFADSGPHVDGDSFEGIALHHNVGDTIPVTLGTTALEFYSVRAVYKPEDIWSLAT